MAKRQLEDKSRQASSKEQGLKLLLVDEDAKDLDHYSAVLRRLGYDVQPVDSYAKAAASLGRERFDLVIVDQGSPAFEGRPVLSRAVEVDRQVPVLVLTGAVDADCCIEALNSGACEYVQKPLTAVEVRELVSDYVKPSMETFSASRNYRLQRDFAEGNKQEADQDSWRKAS